jgi:hypothetical protein
MALLDALLNIGATAMGNAATHLAIHTADPGATGLNPSSAARVAATWPAPSGGDLVISNKNFTGGAPSGPATHVGLWSAITGGTFYGSQALTGDQTFNAAGEYTITSLAVNGSSP